jgi:hypothetical protein
MAATGANGGGDPARSEGPDPGAMVQGSLSSLGEAQEKGSGIFHRLGKL